MSIQPADRAQAKAGPATASQRAPAERHHGRFSDLIGGPRRSAPRVKHPGSPEGPPGHGKMHAAPPTEHGNLHSERHPTEVGQTRTATARNDGRQLREADAQYDARRDDRVADQSRSHAQEATLPAFQPPPAVLWAPTASAFGSPQPAPSGSAQAHAETAAMADRLLESLRVGRSSSGGHEVRLRLSSSSRYAGVEVRLEEEGGALRARLVAEAGSEGRANELAEEIRRELDARGIDLASVELDRA